MSFPCASCGKIFPYQFQAKAHFDSVHNTMKGRKAEAKEPRKAKQAKKSQGAKRAEENARVWVTTGAKINDSPDSDQDSNSSGVTQSSHQKIEAQLVYRCHMCEPPCERTFDTQEALDAHIEPLIETVPPETTYHSEGRFSCDACTPPCEGIFDTWEALTTHLISRMEKSRLDTSSSKEVKGMHVWSMRKKESSLKIARSSRVLFLCNKCQPPCKEFFGTREGLSNHHRSTEQKANLEIGALEKQIKSTKRKSQLETEAIEMQIEALEMRLKFMREEYLYEIETMDAHLKSMKENSRLSATHPSETLPSLACSICNPFCGSIFDTERAYESHLDVVTENAMNTRSTSIKEKHRLDTAHPSKATPPLVCGTCMPPCSSTFDTLESLKTHLELIIEKSQLVITRYSEYQFPCDKCNPPCGKIFDTVEALKTHVKTMTGQLPCYTCSPSCGRTFNTQGALEIHLELVGEKLRRSTSRYSRNKWSLLISETPESIEKLRSMTHSIDILAKCQERQEIKCIGCHGLSSKLEDPICRYHPGKWEKYETKTRASCCGKRSPGCIVLNNHVLLNLGDPEAAAKSLTFQGTPSPSPSHPKRKAVALGCGMGISAKSTAELIQLSAVDYFTGEILIDMIVRPKLKIVDYRPRYSGVTEELVKRAIKRGDFLKSPEGARAELWKWIDSETILIGHSLNHAFWLLQINHHIIIDSSISVPKLQPKSSNLKSLCQKHLKETIQNGEDGHDCVGDSLAARELVIWCSRK